MNDGVCTQSARTGRPGSTLGRIARFTATRYRPHYLVYAALWVPAVEGTAALVVGDGPWRPTIGLVARIAIVAVLLLWMRMLDEIKDVDHDRVHHPDRPLVTGAVSASDLWAALALLACVTVAAAAVQSIPSSVVLAGAYAYGVALWALDRSWRPVRASALVELAVTFPVQWWVTAYVLVAAVDTGALPADPRIVTVVVVFTGAFLSFEFARKTSRTGTPGDGRYSTVLGAAVSAWCSLACVVAAVGGYVALTRPWEHQGAAATTVAWLPVATSAVAFAGAFRFARGADPHPAAPAVVFVLLFYATLVLAAVTA